MLVQSTNPRNALAGSGATGVLMSDKAEIVAWLKKAAAAAGFKRHAELARRIGVSPSTMSRWFNPNDPSKPETPNMRRLVDVLKSAPEGWFQPGFAEGPGHGLVSEPPQPDGLARWRVADASMLAAGFLPGDVVTVDPAVAPVDGDVVVAQVSEIDKDKRMVLRVFKLPGLLLPAALTPALLEVHHVGSTARIQGVVVETVRRRPAK